MGGPLSPLSIYDVTFNTSAGAEENGFLSNEFLNHKSSRKISLVRWRTGKPAKKSVTFGAHYEHPFIKPAIACNLVQIWAQNRRNFKGFY
jgi:hypothetical protein